MTGAVAAVVAVLGWSVYATLAHGVKGAPVFPVLLWEFVAAAVGTGLAALILVRRSGRPFKTSPRSVAIASLGQFGFNVFFLAALPFAPTTHVNLTAYLWPAMVVLALPLIERTPFRPAAALGVLLGFAGVAVLIWEPGALHRSGQPAGYLLALACGGCWAAYSLLRRFTPDETAPTLAVSFAVCAAGAGAIALARGDALLPSPEALLAAVAIGLVPIALANSAWDVAIRTGERGRAALLSYAVPVLSTALIVAWTELQADLALALGAALVTLGVSLPEIAARRRRLLRPGAVNDKGKRYLFFALGIVSTGLGFVGAVLPILPTVPFLIVAVWAFSRSSQRFHDWLYNHPTYGPTLRRWDKYRVVPPVAKIWTVVAMAGGLTLTTIFTPIPIWAVAGAAVGMGLVAAYILTRPSYPPPGAEL